MKKNIIKLLFAVLALFVVVSCDYNDYNEDHLPGFDANPGITDIESLKYTLTDADYKTIASNKENKAIAEAAGKDAVKALEDLAKKKCFTEVITAKQYLPAFLKAGYDTYLTNGSNIEVTYGKAINLPKELAPLAASETYTLTAEDYAVAWGEVAATYFTPAKPADSYLPRILKKALTTNKEGDYAVASYAYSDAEPSTGGGEPAEVINKISEIVAVGDYIIQGKVSATYARGVILSDESGSILLYLNAVPNYSLGDMLKVKGAVAQYNGCFQFGNTAEVTLLSRTPEFTFPTPETMNGAALDAYLTAPTIKYVTYTGTLSISTNKGKTYYNVAVEGTTTAQGSLQYPNPAQIDPTLNGKKVVVSGYLSSVSSKKYANTIVTSIFEEGTTAAYTPTGIVAAAKTGPYKVKGSIVATHTKGFVINDGTGPILMYVGKAVNFVPGDIVTIDGTTELRDGLIQFPRSATTAKVNTEAIAFVHPAAQEMTGADMDAYLTLSSVKYVKYTGTLRITTNDSGKTYCNVENDEAAKAQGSLSNPNDALNVAALKDKKVVVTGYVLGCSSGKFINTMVTEIAEALAVAPGAFSTRAAVTKTRYAVYSYTGTTWEQASNTVMVNPEDYKSMGLSYANFSSSDQPETYLPTFLKLTFPYAAAEDKMFVLYHFKGKKEIELHADQYLFDGTVWTKTLNITSEAGRFIKKDGVWTYNPSLTIVLNPDKSPFSKSYYQAVVDYVLATKDKLYCTDNRSGKVYEDQEYYSGCAAGYCNLNWRINTLPVYYWKAVEGEEAVKPYIYPADADKSVIRACEEAFYAEAEKRFGETMSAALGVMHHDAKMIEGIDIVYTVQMMLYTSNIGSSTGRVTHAFEFKLVADGKFEYVKMYELAPEFKLIQD
ncbi:MAG: hypothetical protein RRY33_05680 [Alistipes sp.]